jgi:sarcosine oxidase, subunit delta
MKQLRCPLNGARPIEEFACGGEVRRGPDPDICSDAQWADHVFNRNGAPAVKREWWYHVPSGYWFIAERDTASDVVVTTYGPERLRERFA